MGWLGSAWAAAPFPDAWVDLTYGGAPATEPTSDRSPSAPAPLELSGGGATWATADTLFVRLDVASDPRGGEGTWGVLVDADADPATFEFVLAASGPNLVVALFANAGGAAGTWAPIEQVAPLGDAGSGDALATASTVEIQVAVAELGAVGVGAATGMRMVPFTSVYWPLGLADVGGCDGAVDPCDQVAAVVADTVTVDADLDGLSGPLEAGAGTDARDADTDNDGVPDGVEAFDADADGVNDALECDTDGDGLSDGMELGYTAGTAQTKDGCYVPDTDPATMTDPAASDSDGGGLSDAVEDANRDGAVSLWEPDPNDPVDDVDSDADTVPDVFDDLFGGGADVDSDGDGLYDATEGNGDRDADGLPDFADPDADGDGFNDAIEGSADADSDGHPDFQDTDADNDGVSDAIEGELDSDADGLLDRIDTDSDADGSFDGTEGQLDTDGDGIVDRLDEDSDGDTILDVWEGPDGVDWDLDGILDLRDPDADNDGWLDVIEANVDPLTGEPADTDRDGVPDFRDLDSDDDGADDSRESNTSDNDCDGLVGRLDPDGEDSFCDTGVLTPDIGQTELPGPVPIEVDEHGCSTSPSVGGWALAWAVVAAMRRSGRRGRARRGSER